MFALLAAAVALSAPMTARAEGTETNCEDRIDDDQDGYITVEELH